MLLTDIHKNVKIHNFLYEPAYKRTFIIPLRTLLRKGNSINTGYGEMVYISLIYIAAILLPQWRFSVQWNI